MLLSLVLIAAACSNGDDDAADQTTAAAAASTTAAAAASTTTAAASTTTAPATTAPVGDAAGFAIASVTFGDDAMVLITNTGTESADLSGHWLCQRPGYAQIPDLTLGPGEQAAIPLGDGAFDPPPGAITVDPVIGVGGLDAESGELALYSSAEFGDAAAIVSYVEWGDTGHGRSGLAVTAGIWPEGGFVATTDATTGIVAATVPAPTPDAWSAGG